MHQLYHPHPPGEKASAADRHIYELDAALTVVENARKRGLKEIETDFDTLALVWQRTWIEFEALMQIERRRAWRKAHG